LSHGIHVTNIHTTQFLLETQHPKSVLKRLPLLGNTCCSLRESQEIEEGRLCYQNAKILMLQQADITVLDRINTAATGLKKFCDLIFIRVKRTPGM